MKCPQTAIDKLQDMAAKLCDRIEALESCEHERECSCADKAEVLQAQADAIGEAVDTLEGCDWDE